MSERLDHVTTASRPKEEAVDDPGRSRDHGEGETGLQELIERTTELVRGLPGPVRRLAMRTGGCDVEIEWAVADEAAVVAPAQPPVTRSMLAPQAPATTGPVDEDVDTVVVRAPLVGTFYAAPQPGADPFVAVGDDVEPGQTLAIIEAMKLMNHIVAETRGRVVEICVGNGDSVEFEQPMLRIAQLADDRAA